MSRSTPQVGWHNARESKPTQGLRVILKIAILGDEGDEDHVIGYWSDRWEICGVCIEHEDVINPEFDQSDVIAWHIIPS